MLLKLVSLLMSEFLRLATKLKLAEPAKVKDSPAALSATTSTVSLKPTVVRVIPESLVQLDQCIHKKSLRAKRCLAKWVMSKFQY